MFIRACHSRLWQPIRLRAAYLRAPPAVIRPTAQRALEEEILPSKWVSRLEARCRPTCAGADRAIMRRNRSWFGLCSRSSSEVDVAKPPGSSAFSLGGPRWILVVRTTSG